MFKTLNLSIAHFACMHRVSHVELRRQLAGVSSLWLPCGFQGLNSGLPTWWQVPYPLSHLSGRSCDFKSVTETVHFSNLLRLNWVSFSVFLYVLFLAIWDEFLRGQMSLALNLWTSCLSLPKAGVTNVHHLVYNWVPTENVLDLYLTT